MLNQQCAYSRECTSVQQNQIDLQKFTSSRGHGLVAQWLEQPTRNRKVRTVHWEEEILKNFEIFFIQFGKLQVNPELHTVILSYGTPQSP